MRQIVTVGLWLAIASTLPGCFFGGDHYEPTTLGASATFDYEGDQIDQATSQADAYCGQFGLKAVLRTTGSHEGKHFAVYDCH